MLDFLIVDNYDSFTYNLKHLCHQMLQTVNNHPGNLLVRRPEQLSLDEIETLHPTVILISPGPGTPQEAVFSRQVVSRFGGRIPIFGVCLGLQVIAECSQAKVVRGHPVHGKTDNVRHDHQHGLFEGIPSPFTVVRYHSLCVNENSVTQGSITPLAWASDGTIMALESRVYPMAWGVQFHPESIGSQYGQRLLQNVYMAASRLVKDDMIKSSQESCSSK